ncbi:MAG: hypothetical protein E7Z75_10030 [Methanobrevibacter olleyae]|uniref:Uncharacterized protein n=1 Tax=Methanobrevibacter olleyae TaxID=294671 RepID=A0A8T3VYJ5_METOL|nr:hypothetical protein [Methanobrevibacter olleyae]
MSENTVKTYYKDLNYLVILNFIIIIFILFSNQLNNILNNKELISSLIPILLEGTFLSNIPLFVKDIIPTDILMKIIFLKHYKEPLPSGRVFENIEEDVLIDEKYLINKYFSDNEKIPENYVESHRAWYKIYREYSDDPRTEQSQKDYLFYRDSFASILIILVFTPIIICVNCIFNIDMNLNIKYLILFYSFLSIELLLYWYLTIIKGKSFVRGVLITASHVKKDIKKIEVHHKF